MSRICICVINGTEKNNELLQQEISALLKCYDFSVFWNLSYEEPFLDRYRKENQVVFSLSDNDRYDNCEMLLLPDKNLVNGKNNPLPFSIRMCCLAEFLGKILSSCTSVDLFIGESGMEYSEFEKKSIHICDFSLIVDCLNTAIPPDLHLSISK
jgi:hypothetical protein